MKKLKRILPRRIFSEQFKRARVQEYETGEFTVIELSKLYNVREQVIYRWINKFSRINKRNVIIVEEKNSSSKKLKEYEQRIKELEMIVGQKQIRLDYLEKLMKLAEADLGVNLKKNTESILSGGSKKTNED